MDTHMARTVTAISNRRAFSEIAAGITPAGLEQFKLERLFELRAVIAAMRTEQAVDRPSQSGRRDHRRPAQ
jgi:hypothetical protein